MNGIRGLIKETLGDPLPLPPWEVTVKRWPFVNWEAGSHQTLNPLSLDLELPASVTVRNTFLLFASHSKVFCLWYFYHSTPSEWAYLYFTFHQFFWVLMS